MAGSAAFDVGLVAAELRTAERSAMPAPLLTERFDGLTWDQARAVAVATDDLRTAEGECMIGYKLGWTSAEMRHALGIDRPNWGTLWDSQLVDGSLSCEQLIHPKVEPELVYRATADLMPGLATSAVAAGEWALGLEVVDPRFPSFDFDWLDNTADNSSSARVLVGPFSPLSGGPAACHVTFDDGSESRTGIGSNAMDNPAAAVVWLVDRLAETETVIEAGHLVFTGGLTAPFDVRRGTDYTVEAEQLGRITLSAR